MARAVTMTKVKNLTREIRRESAAVDATVEAIRHLVTNRDPSLGTISDFLASPQGAYARGNLQEMLNVIDGNSALLREMLVMPGGEL